jgi:hypothetical protein
VQGRVRSRSCRGRLIEATQPPLAIRRWIMPRNLERPPFHGSGGVGLRSWRMSSIRVRTDSFPSECVMM